MGFSYNGHDEVVRVTLGHLRNYEWQDHASATTEQFTVHWATTRARVTAVNVLLDVSPDINAKAQTRDTPLHFAIANEHAKMAELLMPRMEREHDDAAGADEGYWEMVRLLVILES